MRKRGRAATRSPVLRATRIFSLQIGDAGLEPCDVCGSGLCRVMVHKQCHMGVCYCRLCMELENGMMSKEERAQERKRQASGAHA